MPNYNWSEPESNAPITYSNAFGEVVLEPVTGFMPVSEISREKVPEINAVLVSLDEAEQVTLVTENRRAYMSVCFPFLPEDKAAYALKYSCVNRASVCRVTIKRFQTPGNISAQEQIESMAPKTTGPLPV
jgi:ribosomal protein S1